MYDKNRFEHLRNSYFVLFFGVLDFWNKFVYVWCVLHFKLLCLMCLSDPVSFSVYMNIFEVVFYDF